MMKKEKKSPALSAIVIIGACRKRSQRAVDALYGQTAAKLMEIIIVDIAEADCLKLETRTAIPTLYIKRPHDETWAHARACGIYQAQGKIIAFIEDHTIPAKNWAEILIQAHRLQYAAVGYAFTNANPGTYMSRASMLSDYALWMDPLPSGQAKLLPGNNVSYKRNILLSLGNRLETELGVDFNIHEALVQQGHSLYLEGRAQVAHENYDTLRALLGANHFYCWLLAANRAQSRSWSFIRRLFYGIAAPLGAPFIKFIRLIVSLKGRKSLWDPFWKSLPVVIIAYFWSAIGESMGYLFGKGSSDKEFTTWELNRERTTRK
jgi:hypothetical protein